MRSAVACCFDMIAPLNRVASARLKLTRSAPSKRASVTFASDQDGFAEIHCGEIGALEVDAVERRTAERQAVKPRADQKTIFKCQAQRARVRDLDTRQLAIVKRGRTPGTPGANRHC